MRLLHNIVSHGILIMLLVGGLFFYMYRMELTPSWFVQNETGETATSSLPDVGAESRVEPPAVRAKIPGKRTTPVAPPPQAPVSADAVARVPEPTGPAEESGLPPIVAESGDTPIVVEPGDTSIVAESGLPPIVDTRVAEVAAPVAAPDLRPRVLPGTAMPGGVTPVREPEGIPPAAKSTGAPASPPVAEAPRPEVAPAVPAKPQYRPAEPGGQQQPAPATPAQPQYRPAEPRVQREPAPATPAQPQYRPTEPAVQPAPGAQQQTTHRWTPNGSGAADTGAVMPVRPVQAVREEAETSITAARKAFWRRDLKAAERNYRSAIQLAPERSEAWGELGNVLYSQGRWQEAAEAYQHAVTQLIDRGETQRAEHLLKVIRSLDAGMARELEHRLSGSVR